MQHMLSQNEVILFPSVTVSRNDVNIYNGWTKKSSPHQNLIDLDHNGY